MQLGGKAIVTTVEQGADILAESEILDSLDIGHSFIYKLLHPTHGRLVLVDCYAGDSAVMPI